MPYKYKYCIILGVFMKRNHSNRIISTPSAYARSHYLYVQETGTLQSLESHISKREHLQSLLFFIVNKGSGYLTLRGKRFHIHSGDCIFINCLDEYSHESSDEDPWELSWVHFYGKDAAEIYRHFTEQDSNIVFHPSDPTPFLAALHNIYEELSLKHAYFEQKCHKYLTDIITLCYTENNTSEKKSGGSGLDKIIAVRDYLDENYSRNIVLDDLENLFYISKFHLSREFKKLTGITIMNYLNSRRISEAKKMLRFTDQSIGSIALACGIPDVNYFTKVFTRYESMTPSSYRKLWH